MATSTPILKSTDPASRERERFESMMGGGEEKGKEAFDQTVEKTSSYVKEIKDQLQETSKEVPRLIRRYPLESVLIGVGVGFAASFLIRRALR